MEANEDTFMPIVLVSPPAWLIRQILFTYLSNEQYTYLFLKLISSLSLKTIEEISVINCKSTNLVSFIEMVPIL
jgi:hypothetical protein